MKRIRSAAWSVLAFALAAVITPFVVLWMYVTGPIEDDPIEPEGDPRWN